MNPSLDDLRAAAEAEWQETLDRYEAELTAQLAGSGRVDDEATPAEGRLRMTTKRVAYRKLAFAHYEQLGQVVCAHCGFGIRDVLEVAHIDGDRSHNEPSNWVILCPNCHKMYDLDLITAETIILMRDRPKIVVWAKRMKDAGAKAAKTRSERAKWKNAGLKAAETRKRNATGG